MQQIILNDGMLGEKQELNLSWLQQPQISFSQTASTNAWRGHERKTKILK